MLFTHSVALVGGALVAQVGSKSCTFNSENEEGSAYFRQRYKKIVDYVSSTERLHFAIERFTVRAVAKKAFMYMPHILFVM